LVLAKVLGWELVLRLVLVLASVMASPGEWASVAGWGMVWVGKWESALGWPCESVALSAWAKVLVGR
jgi:hypothetical protein